MNQNINEAYVRIENNLKIRTRFKSGKEDYDIYACNTCTCMYLLIWVLVEFIVTCTAKYRAYSTSSFQLIHCTATKLSHMIYKSAFIYTCIHYLHNQRVCMPRPNWAGFRSQLCFVWNFFWLSLLWLYEY